MNKLKSFAHWCKTNADEIAASAVILGTVAFSVWVVRVNNREIAAWNEAIQKQIDHENEVNQWVVDQINDGNDVFTLALPDQFLVMPKDAPREIVIK